MARQRERTAVGGDLPRDTYESRLQRSTDGGCTALATDNDKAPVKRPARNRASEFLREEENQGRDGGMTRRNDDE